jgi:hypothetical protein
MTSKETANKVNQALGYGCYGVAAYQFLQFSLFSGNAALYYPSLSWLFPNSVDDSLHVIHPNAKWEWQLEHPLVNDILLLVMYAGFHSLLSRLYVKNFLRRYTSFWFERLCFIMTSAISFNTLTYYWKPFTGIVMWNVYGNVLGSFMQGIYLASLAWTCLTLAYTAQYDLFDFRKAFGEIGVPPGIPYNIPPVYRVNRQPLFFGLLISFWATPKMTFGHFVFALFMTVYTLKSVSFQEHDAKKVIGAKFIEYQNTVPLYYPAINNLFNGQFAAATATTTQEELTKKKDITFPPPSPIDVKNYQHVNRR